MRVAIRDHDSSGLALIPFEPIADCLEPEARKCFWQVRYVDGMLPQNNDSYTIDDAYADAEASMAAPLPWLALRSWASRFFQIYDCEFKAVENRCCDITVSCLDSSQWEISTQRENIVQRLRASFNDTEEVLDD